MEKISRAKAIRDKCLDCCNGQANKVRLYNIERCALHPYRTGHVKTGRKMSEENKLRARTALLNRKNNNRMENTEGNNE